MSNSIDLYEFLVSFGLPRNRSVKIYRHVDPPFITIRQLVENGDIDLFQAVQATRQLGDDLVLFFASEAGRMSRFIGARLVLSASSYPGATGPGVDAAIEKKFLGEGKAVWHELAPFPPLEPLVNRLTVQWPKEGRHHQWLYEQGAGKTPSNRFSVNSVRALGFDQEFPGFDDILLSHADLRRLALEGDGEMGWISALSSTRGAYLITDTGSGELYVGSATGEFSFWGRWKTYAKTVHGGNKILSERHHDDASFASRLQYSILETVSNLASPEDGLQVERRWKRKLGKKAVALNAN